jgi:hypothetical protein
MGHDETLFCLIIQKIVRLEEKFTGHAIHVHEPIRANCEREVSVL